MLDGQMVKLVFQTGPLVPLAFRYKTMRVVPRKGEMVSVPGNNDKMIHHRVFDVQHDVMRDEVVIWLDAIGGDPPYR